MGLLDDAIREHLELKRRRGADAGEIAHQERAALEPVFRDEQADPEEHPEALDEPDLLHADGAEPAGVAEQSPGEAVWPASSEPELAELAEVAGQETAEIDMRAVLEDEHDGYREASEPVAPARPSGELDGGSNLEGSLEWEVRGSGGEQVPEDVPGQERLSFE